MQADLASDLRERRGRREILGKHLSDGVEPWLAVFDVALSCGGGRELEREALDRERRVDVGLCELPTDVMREHRCPPVSEAAEPSGFLIGLDHHDPRAISPKRSSCRSSAGISTTVPAIASSSNLENVFRTSPLITTARQLCG